MLTSRITKTIAHPDEPGVEFTLRKLSYAQIEEAADAKRDKALALMKALGGVELPDPYEGMAPEERERAKVDAQHDAEKALNKYDRETVLRHGITAWSYDAPLKENIGDLDESTAAWLFAAIIGHSLRSADEGEASGSVSTPTTA